MKVLAPAKLNLWLSVGARRTDGYHEILSVMQSLSLADEVELSLAEATTLDVRPPGSAPEDDSNLVVRAARAMMAAIGTSDGAAISLRKRIPVAAGLGGGSADAAATLVGLNELWGAGISKKALEKMGAGIGADVPFCVRGGTAIARGTGDDLSPAACRTPLWWVLADGGGAKPSTKEVYDAFDRKGGGALEDPYALADALARGDLAGIAANLRNDLGPAAFSLDGDVELFGDELLAAGALGAVLAGSGPVWAGLARDETHAHRVAEQVGSAADWMQVVRSLDHGARITER